jgi:signal transduction histidine kinase
MRKISTNISKEPHRHVSLRTKLGLSFSILTIATSAALIFVLYRTVQSKLRQDIRQRVYDIVNISALQLDGDAHSTLVDPNQEGNTVYMRIKRVLQNIRGRERDIRYIYTWRRSSNGQIIFVVDAETDPKKISHLGDVYDSAEPSLIAKLNALSYTMVDKEFTTDKWGVWLSGYAPFYRSDGRMEGILGVDIAAANVLLHERQFLWNAIMVFIIVVIPTSLILGWLAGGKLAAPIIKLTAGSERIIKGDLNYRVAIQNNDEVGILAKSFNRMTESVQKTIIDRDGEIAHRKRVEKALKESNEDLADAVRQLSQANRELKEFTYIAAHDLKSPVRAIGNLAGMISNSCHNALDEQSRQHLDMLVQRAERLNNFINGLLEYSTLERAALEQEKVDINDVVNEVIDGISAPKETIAITVEDEMPVITGQRAQIIQVFQSLLENAVKYMDKPKGRIRINCVEENDFWQFSVADNGPGIEERYFDRIFQIFQTLTPRDEIESAGIGLSMARKIVEIYGGKIWVESKTGEGSIFFFTLSKQEKGVKNAKSYANTAC